MDRKPTFKFIKRNQSQGSLYENAMNYKRSNSLCKVASQHLNNKNSLLLDKSNDLRSHNSQTLYKKRNTPNKQQCSSYLAKSNTYIVQKTELDSILKAKLPKFHYQNTVGKESSHKPYVSIFDRLSEQQTFSKFAHLPDNNDSNEKLNNNFLQFEQIRSVPYRQSSNSFANSVFGPVIKNNKFSSSQSIFHKIQSRQPISTSQVTKKYQIINDILNQKQTIVENPQLVKQIKKVDAIGLLTKYEQSFKQNTIETPNCKEPLIKIHFNSNSRHGYTRNKLGTFYYYR